MYTSEAADKIVNAIEKYVRAEIAATSDLGLNREQR